MVHSLKLVIAPPSHCPSDSAQNRRSITVNQPRGEINPHNHSLNPTEHLNASQWFPRANQCLFARWKCCAFLA